MAAVTLAIRSEREFGDAVLVGTDANVDGAVQTVLSLPDGFGDCYIRRVLVNARQIATMMATPELFGPGMALVSGGLGRDFLTSLRWNRSYTLELAAAFEPLLAIQWQASETLNVDADEVDTNVAPTVDIVVYVLVRRIRQEKPDWGLPVMAFTS